MSFFTVAGDLIHEDIIAPVENFYENSIEPIFEKDAPVVAQAALDIENVAEKYFEQFADGIGADAMAKGLELVNGVESLTSLGDVPAFALKIGAELLSDAEKLAVQDAQLAIDAAKNIILNAARTILTAAVVNNAQTAAAQVAAGSTVAQVVPDPKSDSGASDQSSQSDTTGATNAANENA